MESRRVMVANVVYAARAEAPQFYPVGCRTRLSVFLQRMDAYRPLAEETELQAARDTVGHFQDFGAGVDAEQTADVGLEQRQPAPEMFRRNPAQHHVLAEYIALEIARVEQDLAPE